MYGMEDCLRFLIQKGGKIELVNNEGFKPKELI
jgi:hypothetical protein